MMGVPDVGLRVAGEGRNPLDHFDSAGPTEHGSVPAEVPLLFRTMSAQASHLVCMGAICAHHHVSGFTAHDQATVLLTALSLGG